MRLKYFAPIAALAAACTMGGPGEDSLDPGGDPGTDTDGDNDNGTQGPNFEVLLTDAPGDFDEVWVDIVSVEVESAAEGWIQLTDEPQSFDLLTLQNDVTAALGDADLAPGHYGQMRLIVDNAHVIRDGASEPLKIASGAQTGIKLNLDADIEENMTYTVVIDFDAAKSIKSTGQGLLMTPVIFVKEFVGVPMPEEEPEDGQTDDGQTDDGSADDGSTDDGSTDDGATDPVE